MRTARRIVLLAVAAWWMVSGGSVAQAQSVEKGTFGLGIILGEPTGIMAKLYLSDDTAIDGAVGSAFIGGGLHVHADFLWHPWVLEDAELFVLPAYVGGGVRLLDEILGSADIFHLGLRGVVGMLFDFKEIPLDVFAEIAVVLDYSFAETQNFGVDLNAGIGARYYF